MEAMERDTVVARPGACQVALAESPTTGYLWSLAEPPAGVTYVGTASLLPHKDEQVAGGTHARIFQFSVAAAGRYELRFVLKRPWEQAPLKELVVELVVEE